MVKENHVQFWCGYGLVILKGNQAISITAKNQYTLQPSNLNSVLWFFKINVHTEMYAQGYSVQHFSNNKKCK